jgi:poly-gamma-glutamate synthesis protein (capsule biosynthesis protein)
LRLLRTLLLGPILLGPLLASAAEAPATLRLIAVGDVLFARYLESADGVTYRPVARTAEPFAAVEPLLRRADLAFANVETPITEEPAELRVYANRTFRAEPAHAAALFRAGFDVVSLANNHALNLGGQGVLRSLHHLRAAGVVPVGAGATHEEALRPVVLTRRGLRLAFVALTLHNNDRPAADKEGAVAYLRDPELATRALPAVAAARALPGIDFVIVSLHWGREFAPHPHPEQRELAHRLVAAGADVVLGHHPHVVQDIERVGSSLIAYSLGNFLFDQPPLSRRQTLLLELVLARAGARHEVRDVVLHPFIIDHDQHVPRPPVDWEDRGWRRRLMALAPGCTLALSVYLAFLQGAGRAPPPRAVP